MTRSEPSAPRFGADVLRDVERQRRLADRGTGGHNHQIARLEPGRQFIEVAEPRRHTRDELLPLVRPFNRLEA